MPDNKQVTSEGISVREVGTPMAPSAVRTVPDHAVVAVDQWGHKGEFIRGMTLKRAEAEEAGFDWDHAVRVGAIRLLTEAEARSLPTTFVSLPDGTVDEEFRAGTRMYSGLLENLPETVTGPPGPAEPAEFAKPTVAFSGDNQPAARPVRVTGAEEAESESEPPARRRYTRRTGSEAEPAPEPAAGE